MNKNLDERIIGYLLYDKVLALKVFESVRLEYFAPDYRFFAKIALDCIKKYKEAPTIRMLSTQEGWEASFEQFYNSGIEYTKEEGYKPSDFSLDLEYLKERYNKQALLEVGKSVYKMNWDGTDFNDIDKANSEIRKLVAEIERIYVSKIYKDASLKDTATDAEEQYRKVKADPTLARGVRLGLREFDRITNGLRPAELMLIGGESGAGKSALSMNMALNAWLGSNPFPDSLEWVEKGEYSNDGHNVMYFSLEMPFDPLRRRIDANLAGVALNGIRDGTLNEEEEKKFSASITFQKNYNKTFDIIDIPRGCTVNQIESLYLEKCENYKPDLIVVDYLTLMKMDTESESDWLQVGHISELLHEFCRSYNVPCISPVQLNRPPKTNDNKKIPPDQHRTGRSLMIPQNANIMLNIYTRQNEDQRPDMEIHIAKMRDGQKEAFILHKRLDIMRIYDDVPGWSPEVYEFSDNNNDSEE